MADSVEDLKANNQAGRRRLRIGMRSALVLAIGCLVGVAVVLVLIIGIGSGQRNTQTLLNQISAIYMEAITEGVTTTLDDTRYKAEALAELIESDKIPPSTDPDSKLGGAIRAMLASSSSLTNIGFLTPDGILLDGDLLGDEIVVARHDVAEHQLISEELRKSRTRMRGYWGKLIWNSETHQTFLLYRRPVWRNGKFLGLLGTSVDIGRLSDIVSAVGADLGGNAFVTIGETHVVAHRNFINRALGSEKEPVPRIGSVADPLVSIIIRHEPSERSRKNKKLQEIEGDIVRYNETDYFYLKKKIAGLGAEEWQAVLYLPLNQVDDEIMRLFKAAGAGFIVLILSIIAAFALSRIFSAPLRELASTANQVRKLEFVDVDRLPRYRLKELDEAATAFNSMVSGLRLFENYVPATLVRKLVRLGESGAISESRELTVMFTDIVGFTEMAESMSAAKTAEFLNDHFRLIGNVINDHDGTIDKFIGDSVMAFWGAPEPQSNHAERAFETILGIRKALEEDNRKRREAGLKPVRIRIGVHIGPVIVGDIGAPGRVNYTIVGDTVNVASRLEALGHQHDTGNDCTILASNDFIAAAGAEQHSESKGEIVIRGRTTPLLFHEI